MLFMVHAALAWCMQVYGVDQQDANLGKAGIIIACILGAVMVLVFSFISMLILVG